MVKRKKADEIDNKSFEDLLVELEKAVLTLENNDIALEESINLFATSMNLAKLAGDKLQLAEQSVEQIILKGKRCFQCKVSQRFEVLQIYDLLLLKEKN